MARTHPRGPRDRPRRNHPVAMIGTCEPHDTTSSFASGAAALAVHGSISPHSAPERRREVCAARICLTVPNRGLPVDGRKSRTSLREGDELLELRTPDALEDVVADSP